jgi:metacaspase-1
MNIATLDAYAASVKVPSRPKALFMPPKRYALCIGINYKGSPAPLSGCLEDIRRISELLSKSGYEITTLLEEQATGINILKAMINFAKKARTGDTLFFHYSGHGGQMRDTNGDEITGIDSTLVPFDYMTFGQISDDYIYRYLAALVPKGVRLFGIMDACHSGSSFDLRYQIIDQSSIKRTDASGNWIYEPNLLNTALMFQENKQYPKTQGEVYMMSGCHDFQVAADAYINGRYTGALTDCFLKTLQKFDKKYMKWKHLLYNTRGFLKESGFTQTPQLSVGLSPNLEQIVWF